MVKRAHIKNPPPRPLLTEKMKVADLIDLNFQLLGILSRFGMEMGFGEATVAEACHRSGIDVNTFLLICNVYTFDDYLLSEDVLTHVNIEEIIRYLHLSHKYYLETALITLQESIGKMLAPCDEKRKKGVWKFFTDYKEELEKHFEYEENHVFPYVKALREGAVHHAVEHNFEESHSNIEEKIGDLKNIVMKYLPKECDTADIQEVLFFIYYLENDLERHTSLEDHVLLPMINRLEENGDRK